MKLSDKIRTDLNVFCNCCTFNNQDDNDSPCNVCEKNDSSDSCASNYGIHYIKIKKNHTIVELRLKDFLDKITKATNNYIEMCFIGRMLEALHNLGYSSLKEQGLYIKDTFGAHYFKIYEDALHTYITLGV